jgi:Putative Flp pilus-assembly TadE/G-like
MAQMRTRISAGERGQALVIVAISMVVMVGVAALAIDIAAWYDRHHQAQVAADAAALAAAHCMASSTCMTTGAAVGVATNYASANGVTISTSNVNFNGATVTVTTPNPGPAIFAGVFGIGSSAQTAQAAATWTSTNSACSNVGTGGAGCYAIFAYDDTCASGSNHNGVYNNGNSTTVNGAVHSNGSLVNVGNGGASQFPDANSYGGPNNCTASGVTSPTFNPSLLPYPVDYSGLSPVSADNATPPTCTVTVSGNYTYSGGSGVYCDPTGTITVGSGTSAGGATFIAQNIVLNANNASLVPYNWPTNPLLLYQTAGNWNGTSCSTTSATLDIGTGHSTFEGYAFAPCSTINFTSNNSIWNPAFFEGYNVNLQGNSFTGDGPQSAPGGSSLTGRDFLIQ